MQKEQLQQVVISAIDTWVDAECPKLTYRQLRELEEELKDQITARQKQMHQDKELRHVS